MLKRALKGRSPQCHIYAINLVAPNPIIIRNDNGLMTFDQFPTDDATDEVCFYPIRLKATLKPGIRRLSISWF